MNSSDDTLMFPVFAELDRRVLAEFSSSVTSATSALDVAMALAEATRVLLAWDAFTFSERVPGTHDFEDIYAAESGEAEGAEPHEVPRRRRFAPCALIRQGTPMVVNRGVNDTEEGLLEPVNPASPRCVSMLFVPICYGDKIHAIVSVQSYTSERYGERELSLLVMLSVLVAPAIQHMLTTAELNLVLGRYRRAIVLNNAVPYERDFASNRYIHLEREIEALTGYPLEEQTPALWRSLIIECQFHGAMAGRPLDEALAEFEAGRVPMWRADYLIRTREGAERWLSDTAVPLVDRHGAIYGSLGILHDMTDRKRSEQLRHRLSELGTELGGAASMRDVGEHVSNAAAALIGWDFFLLCMNVDQEHVQVVMAVDTIKGVRKDFTQEYINQTTPGALYKQAVSTGAFLTTRDLVDIKKVRRLGNPGRETNSMLFVPIIDNKGERIGALSLQSYEKNYYTQESLETARVVADYCSAALLRTRGQEALQASEERYRRAIAQADAVPYELDLQTGEIQHVGEGISELLGYWPAEINRDVWRHLVLEERPSHETTTASTTEEIVAAMRSGKLANYRSELQMRTRAGKVRWLANSCVVIRDGAATPSRALGILQDVTERRQRENLLRRLNRLGIELSTVTEARTAARLVLDAARDLLGWDAAIVSIHDDKEDLSRPVLMYDTIEGEVRDVTAEHDVPETPGPLYRRTIEHGSQLLNRDDEQARTLGLFGDSQRESESMIFVPLRRQDRNAGVLSIQSYTPGQYDEDAVETVQLLADYCSAAFERAHAEEARRTSENRYRQAITQANAVTYEQRFSDGNYQYVGEGIEELTGLAPADFTGAAWRGLVKEIVLHESMGTGTPAEVGERFRRGEMASWKADYRIVRPDGQVRWISDSAVPLFQGGAAPVGSLGILQDVTARMQTAARDAILSDLGRQLSAVRTAREAARLVCRSARELIGCDSTLLVLFGENDALNVVYCEDTSDGRAEEYNPTEFDEDEDLAEAIRRIGNEGARLVAFTSPEDTERSHLGRWGFRDQRRLSLLYAPLRVQGNRPIGVLSVQSYESLRYHDHDLRLLQTVADHCSNAMQRTSVEERLVRSEARSTAFSSLAQRLNGARSAREAGLIIAETADQLIGWDACNIDFYFDNEDKVYHILTIDTTDGRKVEYSPSTGPRVPSRKARRMLHHGAFMEMRDTGDEVMADDDTNPGRPFGNMTVRSRSLIYVPVRKGRVITGFITIQSYRPGAYSDEDLTTLQALADHCGGALDRLRAEKSLEEERRRISVFAELGRKLAAASSRREAGRIIVDAAQKLIGWDSCFLLLFSEGGDVAVPVHYHVGHEGREIPMLGADPRKRPIGYISQTLMHGKLIVLRNADDVVRDDIFPLGEMEATSRSLLFVCLREQRKVIGVLSIQSSRPDAFTEHDLELLDYLSNHCSGAIERLQAQAAVRLSEERYSLAAQGANDGLWDWDIARRSVYYSPRLAEMLQLAPADLPPNPLAYFDRIHPHDAADFRRVLREHLRQRTRHFQHEHRVRRADGSYFWVLVRGVAVLGETGRPIRMAGSATDISDRRQAQEQLTRAAFYDALTGLPNRVLFMDRLERTLARSRRTPGQLFAVLFLDLDRFKMVNDSLGHMVGDRLLQLFAERLLDTVRDGDTVARLGGDEFIILLDSIRDLAEALRVADRIITRVARPFIIDDKELFTGASVGITLSSLPYERVEDIIRDADTALYRAKEGGKGRYVVFDQEMHNSVLQYVELESGLRRALKNQEFELRYLPVMRVADGTCEGFEAFVRWMRNGEEMMPDKFLPIAEESGLIGPLGDWIVREGCRNLVEWRALSPKARTLHLSIHLSARQFGLADFPTDVESIIIESGLRGSHVRFIVSEKALTTDPAGINAVLESWKKLGIEIVLDDFGTGYSSLNQLLKLPVDALKIDRRIVQSMADSAESRYIAQAIASLACILNRKLIAEGVETPRQMAALQDLGCDSAIGFLFGQPMRHTEIPAFLAKMQVSE